MSAPNKINPNPGQSNLQYQSPILNAAAVIETTSFLATRNYPVQSKPSNQLDMSVQLSRPVSKTVMMVRQRREMLEQVSCHICKGYLIDATTIDKCMDSFCRSCILLHLKHNYDCPKCGAILHTTNPLSCIRPDKVLQSVVYKLVPGLYHNEMKRRRDFYRDLYGATSTSSSSTMSSKLSATSSSSSEDEDVLLNRKSFPNHLNDERYGVITHPKPFYKPSDSIDISLEPQTKTDSTLIYYDNQRQSIVTNFTGDQTSLKFIAGLQSVFSMVDSQQFKTYLRCPAKLTAQQLKKFISSKYNILQDSNVQLLYTNESLKDEYSLIDVTYMFNLNASGHIRLSYTVERNLTTNPIQYYSNKTSMKHKLNSISAEILPGYLTKKICTDPQSLFHKESSINYVNINNKYQCQQGVLYGMDKPSPVDISRTRHGLYEAESKTVKPSVFSSSSVIAKTPVITVTTKPTTSYATQGTDRGPSTSTGQSTIQATRSSQATGSNQPTGSRIIVNNSTIRHKLTDHVQSSFTSVEASKNVLPQIAQTINSTNPVRVLFRRPSELASQQGSGIGSHLSYSNMGQIVPYISSTFNRSTCIAEPPQSTLVTLANFTQAQSGHLFAMNSTSQSSTSMSTNSYKELVNYNSTPKLDVKSGLDTAYTTSSSNASSSDLAFRFTKQHGVTIVQRLRDPEDHPVQSLNQSTINITQSTKPIILPKPTTTCPLVRTETAKTTQAMHTYAVNNQARFNTARVSSDKSQSHHQDIYKFTEQTSSSPSSSSSSRSSSGIVNINPQHIKLSPVRKMFVYSEPKSPNLKNLPNTTKQ